MAAFRGAQNYGQLVRIGTLTTMAESAKLLLQAIAAITAADPALGARLAPYRTSAQQLAAEADRLRLMARSQPSQTIDNVTRMRVNSRLGAAMQAATAVARAGSPASGT